MIREAEAEIVKVLTRVETVQGGDLKGVEHEVLTRVCALGLRILEPLLQGQPETEQAPARRPGACGHEQRLVGTCPTQTVTLLGSITIHQAYDHCTRTPHPARQETPSTCSHGETPADALWGSGTRRTSAGVQEQTSDRCASLTLEKAATTFSRLSPLQMSARQALFLMQPMGEALAHREQRQPEAL